MKKYKWTVEWSEKQKCFHVDTLDGIIKKNLEMFSDGVNCEYSLVGIFNSHDEAHKFVRKLNKYKEAVL